MPIEIKMPALSPTMEEGNLARWLVKEGDAVKSGDLLAEIETDKATMEFEAVDEGTIASIAVVEGTEGVKVGTVIATLLEDGEEPGAAESKPAAEPEAAAESATPKPSAEPTKAQSSKSTSEVQPVRPEPVEGLSSSAGAAPDEKSSPSTSSAGPEGGERQIASPLAKRLAAEKGVDLAAVQGSGPNGRIVKADVEKAEPGAAPAKAAAPASAASAPAPVAAAATSTKLTDAIPDFGIPFEDQKLSGMRKTIARRLTQSMQEAPHIYLTVDVRLDALLKLRGELNEALAARSVKLSVNDLLIKALGLALLQVPSCNVAFAGDVLRQYSRADVSVAVSITGGLITPIVTDAGGKSLAQISTEMADLAERAKAGKLQPSEYQGGTASISNMGMMGIKQFTAVINPPQAAILAIGAGEKRAWVMDDGSLGVATVMTATGSFDHRAIDGADGAKLMAAFKTLVEKPLGLVA